MPDLKWRAANPAAALAYGMDAEKGGKIFVFDLGGGTFDVSVLDVGEGVFEVLSINGDTHLGGDDYDQVIVDHIAEEFRKQQGIDLRKDPMALQRLCRKRNFPPIWKRRSTCRSLRSRANGQAFALSIMPASLNR